VLRTYQYLFGQTERHSIGILEAIDQLVPNMDSGEVAKIHLGKTLCSFLPTHEPRLESIEILLKSA
jgi:hypothetical protein